MRSRVPGRWLMVGAAILASGFLPVSPSTAATDPFIALGAEGTILNGSGIVWYGADSNFWTAGCPSVPVTFTDTGMNVSLPDGSPGRLVALLEAHASYGILWADVIFTPFYQGSTGSMEAGDIYAPAFIIRSLSTTCSFHINSWIRRTWLEGDALATWGPVPIRSLPVS